MGLTARKDGKTIRLTKWLVVYEDLWHNKDTYYTNKIGDTVEEILHHHDIHAEYDKKSLNSNYPYQMGTYGPGFYDIQCHEDDSDDAEWVGRIMIFKTTEE